MKFRWYMKFWCIETNHAIKDNHNCNCDYDGKFAQQISNTGRKKACKLKISECHDHYKCDQIENDTKKKHIWDMFTISFENKVIAKTFALN